jgi:hypothetical protein
MKKIYLTVFCLFVAIFAFGQGFPANSPKLLIGKVVKAKEVKEELRKYLYKNFYTSFDSKKAEFPDDKPKNKLFPTESAVYALSEYGKLVGKEFTVTEVIEVKPKYSFSKTSYALKMKNEEIGDVYYKYDPSFELDFELEVVGGLEYPAGFFCADITEEKDKFENSTKYITPATNGIVIIKIAKGGTKTTYLSLTTSGSTANVGKKGVTILLEGGAKLTFADIVVEPKVNRTSYSYNAFIPLKETDLKALESNKITDFRLYVYDREINSESANKVKEYFKCINQK